MDKKFNAYNRLSLLMSFLLSERYKDGVSVNELSRIMEVPAGVVRNDILTITGNACGGGVALLSDRLTAEELRNSLKTGDTKALDVPLCIAADFMLGDLSGSIVREDTVAVSLTPFEKTVFKEIVHVTDFKEPVLIKKPVFDGAKEIPRILGPLQMAIEQGHPVTFTYKTDTKEERADRFIARSIYRDLFDKNLYLVGKCGDSELKLVRIDFISRVRVHYNENVPGIKKGELDLLDYIWSGGISAEEIRQGARHIKVKIFRETGNIFEKIKTETNARRFGRLYADPEDEQIAYYEDEVCSFGAFKRWLFGYGASVLVLEPRELAREIYEMAVRRLEVYKNN